MPQFLKDILLLCQVRQLLMKVLEIRRRVRGGQSDVSCSHPSIYTWSKSPKWVLLYIYKWVIAITCYN